LVSLSFNVNGWMTANMPAINYRLATQADRDCVIAQQVDSQNEEAALHPSRVQGEAIAGVAWDMLHARGGFMIIAERDGALVGHIGGAPVHDGSPFFVDAWRDYALMFDLYVRPEARRAGIGRNLVEAMRKSLQALGVTRLRIVGLSNNVAALALYQSCGFQPYEVTLEQSLTMGTV
jgi:ribosomal protein S18 acetylase RimI-like enzyme